MISPRYRPFAPHDTPSVMGILNVTPDSFSDGGDFLDPARAIARAREMVREGATIIDIGGESTRPGSAPVSAKEQIARTVPVIEGIRHENDEITLSIDTRLADVARKALCAGADMINDVSAMCDDETIAEVAAEQQAPIVLMHRRGSSADMQRGGGPQYDDVVAEISAFLEERRAFAVSRGIAADRIIFDPGIGFGKRVGHNLTILRHLGRFVALGQPVLVGASRKSFIGSVLGIADPNERAGGSLACAAMAVMAGAAIVRVHDVRATVDVVRLCAATRRSDNTPGT